MPNAISIDDDMPDDQPPTTERAKERDGIRTWIRRVLPWALLAAALFLAVADMRANGSGLVETGSEAPALVADLANGDRFDLADQRGRIVVVNFWATWCAPCRAEAPTLTRIHNRLARHGGTVLGISADRMALPRVAEHALGLGMEYLIGSTDQATLDRFRVTQLPTTYVVSPDGEITWSHVGAVSEERLASAVEAHF